MHGVDTILNVVGQCRAPALGRAHGAHRHDARVRRGAAARDLAYARTRIGASSPASASPACCRARPPPRAARLVRGARADRAAARARGHPRRRRRLGDRRAGVLARREVAVDRAGRARRAGVHVDRSATGARRRAHLHRSRPHAARAGAYRRSRRRRCGRPALFRSLLTGLAGEPVLGFVAAVAVSWLVHSSLSIVLLVMSLAAAQALPVPARARARARRQCRRRARAVPHAVRLAAGRPPRAARQPDDAHRSRRCRCCSSS